jgi:hypothetical protein
VLAPGAASGRKKLTVETVDLASPNGDAAAAVEADDDVIMAVTPGGGRDEEDLDFSSPVSRAEEEEGPPPPEEGLKIEACLPAVRGGRARGPHNHMIAVIRRKHIFVSLVTDSGHMGAPPTPYVKYFLRRTCAQPQDESNRTGEDDEGEALQALPLESPVDDAVREGSFNVRTSRDGRLVLVEGEGDSDEASPTNALEDFEQRCVRPDTPVLDPKGERRFADVVIS